MCLKARAVPHGTALAGGSKPLCGLPKETLSNQLAHHAQPLTGLLSVHGDIHHVRAAGHVVYGAQLRSLLPQGFEHITTFASAHLEFHAILHHEMIFIQMGHGRAVHQ